MKPQRLSAVYGEVSDSAVQITPAALGSIAEMAIEAYRKDKN
jgi:hypothetical protein